MGYAQCINCEIQITGAVFDWSACHNGSCIHCMYVCMLLTKACLVTNQPQINSKGKTNDHLVFMSSDQWTCTWAYKKPSVQINTV